MRISSRKERAIETLDECSDAMTHIIRPRRRIRKIILGVFGYNIYKAIIEKAYAGEPLGGFDYTFGCLK
jgi:hypothetical protein